MSKNNTFWGLREIDIQNWAKLSENNTFEIGGGQTDGRTTSLYIWGFLCKTLTEKYWGGEREEESCQRQSLLELYQFMKISKCNRQHRNKGQLKIKYLLAANDNQKILYWFAFILILAQIFININCYCSPVPSIQSVCVQLVLTNRSCNFGQKTIMLCVGGGLPYHLFPSC